jgi:dTDP-4-amino-4,6-dideoxygalactose transaminase
MHGYKTGQRLFGGTLAKQESTLVELSSDKLIRLSKSCLRDGEKQAVLRVLDKEFLGMGEEVQVFERELTEFFGRQAVCVINGTAALHLALQACGVGSGDEVLVPSLTYVACFQAISATGAVPVACDVDQQSLCLDWRDAEQRITAKTKAIMPVHYSGGVGDLDSIYALAKRAELRVIEDAAHAFGSSYQKRKVGNFGDIACFSFDGIKNITSGEGGCIVTADQEVLRLVRNTRLLGVDKDSELRYEGQRSWEFEVNRQGWRYHMSNVMAAIGIEQLKRFDEITHKRRELAECYVTQFEGSTSIKLIKHDYKEVVPHIFVVHLPSGVSRERVIAALNELNIQTGIHYKPNHQHALFRQESHNPKPQTVTEEVFPSLLSLPLHEDLSFDDVKYVAEKVLEVIDS